MNATMDIILRIGLLLLVPISIYLSANVRRKKLSRHGYSDLVSIFKLVLTMSICCWPLVLRFSWSGTLLLVGTFALMSHVGVEYVARRNFAGGTAHSDESGN